MNVRDTAKALGGACAIYLVMAACGASDRGAGFANDGGPLGSDGASADGTLAALTDAITNPVSEAMAGNPPPDIATETCNQFNDAGPRYYAEHAYPGKTAAELMLVRAYEDDTGAGALLPGYPLINVDSALAVRDGYAAVWTCGSGKTITFVLPQ